MELQFPLRKLQGDFPVILVPPSQASTNLEFLVDVIKEHKRWIEGEIDESGAVVLRGFNVKCGEDFAQVVEAFNYKSMGYEGGAATRSRVAGPVFTANELPLHLEIGFHNEMAYLPDYPDVLMFFCEIAPPEGGATGIIQGRKIYEKMQQDYPEFVKKLEECGLVYYNILEEYGDLGWRKALNAEDRNEAEQRALKLNKRLKWLEDGSVKVMHGPFAGIKEHKKSKLKMWFNNIGSVSPTIPNLRYLEYGDGSEIPEEAIKASLQFMKEEQVAVKWEAGDIAVLDNHAVLHCRHPSKPPRRILVALAKTTLLE